MTSPSPLLSQSLSPQQRKRNWWTLGGWAAFMGATLLFPGSAADGIIFCPFRALTGFSCPGCGMTRSCTAAVRGQLWHALEFHPLGVPLVVGFTLVALWRLAQNLTGRRLELIRSKRARAYVSSAYIGMLIFVLGFGGLRLALEVSGILTRW